MPPIRSVPENPVLARYGSVRSPTRTPPMPIDYPRRRAAIACEVCRQRKSRCDGAKPRCGFCKEIEQQCHYRPAPPAPPSKLEQDIRRMFRRFDNLEDLIRNQKQTALTPPESDYDLKVRRNSIDVMMSEHPKALEPEETRATEAPENSLPYRLHKAVDIPFRFPMYLRLGLTTPGVPFRIPLRCSRTLPSACPGDIDRLMCRYFEKVHFWFPFLDPTLIRDKFMNITPSLTSDYCLFMLIMALGTLAESEQIYYGQQWAEYWAEPAFSMISMITMQDDLTAVHCLILFSVYHMWILNPAHAYNMICVASDKMQNIVERRLKSPMDFSFAAKMEMELEKRAYWVIFIIDNEHRGLFLDKGSGIEVYEDKIELPYSDDTLPGFRDFERNLLYQQASFFFLGCISMRRTCNRAKYTRKHVEEESERLKYNMGSALDIEIETWYQTLPPTIQFDRDINVDAYPGYGNGLAPLVEDNVAWLRGSYMAIPAMAYWQPAFAAATGPGPGQLSDEHREAVIKWQLAFMKYVASARQYLDQKFHPLVWTQSQNLFMGALMGVVLLASSRTYKLALPTLMDYIGHVVNILETFAPFSFSLAESYRSLSGKYQGLKALRSL